MGVQDRPNLCVMRAHICPVAISCLCNGSVCVCVCDYSSFDLLFQDAVSIGTAHMGCYSPIVKLMQVSGFIWSLFKNDVSKIDYRID
jgi:hypothetical protein